MEWLKEFGEFSGTTLNITDPNQLQPFISTISAYRGTENLIDYWNREFSSDLAYKIRILDFKLTVMFRSSSWGSITPVIKGVITHHYKSDFSYKNWVSIISDLVYVDEYGYASKGQLSDLLIQDFDFYYMDCLGDLIAVADFNGESIRIPYADSVVKTLVKSHTLVNNRFFLRSLYGIYYPIEVVLDGGVVLKDIISKQSEFGYSIGYTEEGETVLYAKEKLSLIKLAIYLHKQHGEDSLILDLVNDNPTTTIPLGLLNIKVVDSWYIKNENYAKMIKNFAKLNFYGFNTDTFEEFKLRETSKKIGNGIKLPDNLYNSLGLPVEAVTSGLTHITGNTFAETDEVIGDTEPIKIKFKGMTLVTPYEKVTPNVYSFLPLPYHFKYKKVYELDYITSLLVGKRKQPNWEKLAKLEEAKHLEEQELQEHLESIKELGEIDIDLDFRITITDKMTYDYLDLLKCPYILEVSESEGVITATYSDYSKKSSHKGVGCVSKLFFDSDNFGEVDLNVLDEYVYGILELNSDSEYSARLSEIPGSIEKFSSDFINCLSGNMDARELKQKARDCYNSIGLWSTMNTQEEVLDMSEFIDLDEDNHTQAGQDLMSQFNFEDDDSDMWNMMDDDEDDDLEAPVGISDIVNGELDMDNFFDDLLDIED